MLAEIKTRQDELAKLIAEFEAQKWYFTIPEARIGLAEGEHYAGLILNGDASYHLILLPGEAEDVTFGQARDWTEKSGGELPTRREQALLYANIKEQFKPNCYWSGDCKTSSTAQCCNFQDGCHGRLSLSLQLYARAVRRVFIKEQS